MLESPGRGGLLVSGKSVHMLFVGKLIKEANHQMVSHLAYSIDIAEIRVETSKLLL